jgi:hypothetical protein
MIVIGRMYCTSCCKNLSRNRGGVYFVYVFETRNIVVLRGPGVVRNILKKLVMMLRWETGVFCCFNINLL